MTKIAYIHGIPANIADASEMMQRSALVPVKQNYHIGALSEGEAYLTTVLDQFNILRSYYPEDAALQKGYTMIHNALFAGIHNTAWSWSYSTEPERQAAAAIARAKQMSAPAYVNGGPVGRKHFGQGIGDLLVPLDTPGPAWLCASWGENPNDPLCDPVDQNYNFYANVFNNNLEGAAMHIVYNFKPNGNDMMPDSAWKPSFHKMAVQSLATDSGFAPTLMSGYVRTGILRKTASNTTLGPRQPEVVVSNLKTGAAEGIGLAPAIILALIALASAAVTATQQMVTSVQARKAAEAQAAAVASVQGLKTPSFGPATSDFPGAQSGGGQSGGGQSGGGQNSDNENGKDNTMLIVGGAVLAVGAAFLLLNEK